MRIVSISGEIVAVVDDVMLEQLQIENPKVVEGFPTGLQAMVAAMRHEQTQAIQNLLGKHLYTLVYQDADHQADGWHVRFTITEKKLEHYAS